MISISVVGNFLGTTEPEWTSVQEICQQVTSSVEYQWHNEPMMFSIDIKEKAVRSSQIIDFAWDDKMAVAHYVLILSEKLPDFVFTVEDTECPYLLYEVCDDVDEQSHKALVWNGQVYVTRLNYTVSLPIPNKFKVPLDLLKKNIEEALDQKFHITSVSMPEKALAFLQADPQLIGTALAAFCMKFDERKLDEAPRTAVPSVPENESFVDGFIKLTREQYVQIAFHESKVPSNYESIGYRLYMGIKDSAAWENYQAFSGTYAPIYTQEDSSDWLEEESPLLDSDAEHIYGSDCENMLSKCYDPEMFGSSDDDYEDVSDDSDYDSEQEVLEAIKNDPDLFMKILDLQVQSGANVSDLIDRIKKVSLAAPKGKQKGMADVRSGPELSDDDGEVDLLYNETMEQVRIRLSKE